jgi:hypothetical protein
MASREVQHPVVTRRIGCTGYDAAEVTSVVKEAVVVAQQVFGGIRRPSSLTVRVGPGVQAPQAILQAGRPDIGHR